MYVGGWQATVGISLMNECKCDATKKKNRNSGKEEVIYVEPTDANGETAGQGARNEMATLGIWAVASEVRMLQNTFG